MNGDAVRNIGFPEGRGYRAADVDDFLGRVAAELDAGRRTGPLVEGAMFRTAWRRGCDARAVDAFLEQMIRADPPELPRMDADPWRDLIVGNHVIRGGDGLRGKLFASPGVPSGMGRVISRQDFKLECAGAWRDFGQAPGTRLWLVRSGANHRELQTAGGRTVTSSHHGLRTQIRSGGRTFTLRRVSSSDWRGVETLGSDRPGAPLPSRKDPQVRQLVDQTGAPVLYAGGQHHISQESGAYIRFPGQDWLWFPVRGTSPRNAIMTAVDQDGNKVARYRLVPAKRQWIGVTKVVEIIVHPSQRQTEELGLALALSAPWLISYFASRGGDAQ